MNQAPPDSTDPGNHDSGLLCLLFLARWHGLPADAASLRHRFAVGGAPLDASGLLRAARSLGLRARHREIHADDLAGMPLPLLAQCQDDGWLLVARISAERVLVHLPHERAPRVLDRGEFLQRWNARVILVAQRGAEAQATLHGVGWLLACARPYRTVLFEVLLASIVIQALGLLTPLFFQVVVDKVLVHKVLNTLQVLVVGLLAVSFFEVLLTGLRAWLMAHTTNRLDVTLGARLFAHLLDLPLRFFEARRVGEVVARVRELETLRAFVTGSALTLLLDLGFTVIAFALMYAYSPALTALVALSLPFYLLLSLIATPLLRAQVEQKFRCGAENQSFLVESLSGMATLKAMALEPAMQRRWEQQLAAYVAAAFRAGNTANWAAQGACLINRVVSAALLWFGAGAVIAGTLTVGQLIAFNMFALRTGAPVQRLFQLWQDFQQARVSLARLSDILDAPGERRGPGPRAALPRLRGEVRFERVSFRYAPERAQALCDIDLEVRAGEVLGVVGRSGSGKSTLARLLQRLYLPEQGRILIDGADIALVSPESLRRQIGVVPQDCFLFNATVAENIAPGDPGMPLERITAAATLAGAHAFIAELPYGYDTPLGEHAHILSGGQKQRLAIARALVRDPRILVFDEATSALDYESELAVRTNLAGICAGRTVLIIAHRLSALAHCDRLVVLDRGRIVEQGTHAGLLARQGIYARLHALQSLDRAA